MKIYNVAQGAQAWLELRAGKITASCIDQIITKSGRKSEQRHKYLCHLLAERYQGRPIDGFKSKFMELGNEYEDRVIAAYELDHDCETYRVGFVTTDDGRIGCSPDRFIVGDDRGAVEAKSPTPAVHMTYLLSGVGASDEYKVQVQAQLWLCEREWVDIVSYCPGFPAATYRVQRDEKFIADMATEVTLFSRDLERLWAQVSENYPVPDRKSAEVDSALGITDEDIAGLTEYYEREVWSK